MDNTRITIALTQRERSALMKLAAAELRSPRDQARYILRKELERLGLLEPAIDIDQNTTTDQVKKLIPMPGADLYIGGQSCSDNAN